MSTFVISDGTAYPGLKPDHLEVLSLGEATFKSEFISDYIDDSRRVRFSVETGDADEHSFELAGPRPRIFFDPKETNAAIVTCGGLSPGLNNVIRSLTLELLRNYKVKAVYGVPSGFRGLNPAAGLELIPLTQRFVRDIHTKGGTVLGSSRGPQDVDVMVDYLVAKNISVLFCVGGDGTMRGAHAIFEEVERRNLSLSVVGIPKTIDNDIHFVSKSFGYETSAEQAVMAIRRAHTEAKCAPHGVGLVKLFGRHAGFIAALATIASQDVNFCLVPEVNFDLDDLLASLKERLLDPERGHAVVVVAEGAGQHLLDGERQTDASGNVRAIDPGPFLNKAIKGYFKELGKELNLKYIDPSYMIRSVAANTFDSVLCDSLARAAAHAGMAGKTDLVLGYWHGVFTHVPISTAVALKKNLSLHSDLWCSVQRSTGQPAWPAAEQNWAFLRKHFPSIHKPGNGNGNGKGKGKGEAASGSPAKPTHSTAL